jgi:hypothetical protein
MGDEPELACMDPRTSALICAEPPGPAAGSSPVHAWSTVDKIGSAIRRSFSRMPPGETAAKLASLLEPTTMLRYLEEALAESYAQLRVNGIKGLPAGIRLPVASGAYNLTISGILREAAVAGGIYLGTITVGGIVMHVYLEGR